MTTENDVKNAIIELLVYRGALVLRVNSGSFTGEHNGKRRFLWFVRWLAAGWGEQVSGVSDILAILPGGVPLAVECKKPGKKGRVTEAQENFMSQWKSHGGIAIVADSTDDVMVMLDELHQ